MIIYDNMSTNHLIGALSRDLLEWLPDQLVKVRTIQQ